MQTRATLSRVSAGSSCPRRRHGLDHPTRRVERPPGSACRAGVPHLANIERMADIRQVDGLDVRAGQLLRHSSGVIVKVTGAMRQKKAGRIVIVLQVERTDNGQRGYLELHEGQTFTVGAGLRSEE
jgi:hypothetical protein